MNARRGRSVCIALLPLLRDLCFHTKALFCSLAISTKLPLVIHLSGATNYNADRHRWKLLSATHPCLGRLTASPPLKVPSAEPDGASWPEYCGFVKMPHTQDRRLTKRHGSFELNPAEQVGSFMASRTMAALATRYPQASTALRAEDVSNEPPVFCCSWHKRGRSFCSLCRRPACVRNRANSFLLHDFLATCAAVQLSSCLVC